MAHDPYRYFRVEARELLDQLGAATLELERVPEGADVVQRLLRLAHTLKGAARVVKQPEIADGAHAIEEALTPYRDTGGRVPRDPIDGILKLLDGVGVRLRTLEPMEQRDASAAGRGPVEEGLRIVRANVAEVDALLDGLLEMHVQLRALRRAARQAEGAHHLGEMLAEQLSPRGIGDNLRAAAGTPGKALSMAEELRAMFGTLERGIVAAVDQIDRELRGVRDTAEHLRLVPAGTVFTSLERTARDTAQSLGRQLLFDGRGGDVRIDAHVLGAIQAALVQVVRNAVAHGIEPTAERQAVGKPPAGRLVVEIARRGRRVVFRCQDDGRGVDLDAVRRAATRRGLAAAKTEKLGPEELVRLLLRGGISTSPVVTEVSGRGIGLDVVREAIERLGGEVGIRTERGRGTTFELIVPLSLASLEGLSVQSSGIAATIPLDAVKHTMRVTSGEVSRTARGESLVYEGMAIPFVSLPRALRARSVPGVGLSARPGSAVIVEGGGRLAALGVDRVLGTTHVVLRPLPELVPADPIVAGSSLDAEGDPQLVLDPEGIIAAARAASLDPEISAARHPVLVIDDSLTTRMLEQSILESAGYEVDLATSGEEALQAARGKKYALFLVDVEMPGMDGFTFIERARTEPSLRNVPVILVTSRTGAEDRHRGELAGAQGYIVKSEFDQADLLARIKRLVE